MTGSWNIRQEFEGVVDVFAQRLVRISSCFHERIATETNSDHLLDLIMLEAFLR